MNKVLIVVIVVMAILSAVKTVIHLNRKEHFGAFLFGFLAVFARVTVFML